MLDYGSLQNRLKSPFLKFLGRNQYLAHRRMQSMCSASVCVLPLFLNSRCVSGALAPDVKPPTRTKSYPKARFSTEKSMAYENF